MTKEENKQTEVEIELTDEEIKTIERLAEEKKLSFNDTVVQILEDFIKEQELQSEVTVEKIEE